MKILHITDSHGTVKGPESRTDIYYITFLRKLYELGYVIKHQNIDMVIHTGDLFHTARVSDKFAGQVSEQMKAWGVPIYVVPGNHDIEGYTTDTIDQTKLGLLAKTGVIQLLDRDHPVTINAEQNGETYTVAISGQEYYAHIDEGNPQDFDMQQDAADLNILAAHAYLTDTPQHPDIKCTMCQNVVTDADIILTGHYHRSFEWDGPDVSIYNPGSMMRVEQTDYNKNHIPQYGILDITLDSNGGIVYDYFCHRFKVAQPSTSIFDYNAKYKAKAISITLDGFKNSLANTMNQIQPSASVQGIIDNICQDPNNNIDAALHQLATKVYQDTLQIIPDDFEVQPGFIEAQRTKKITKVILENFQSHKHTEVDFDDGLNIIVGESNNGKTSILRGIMWVIDNHPLGTDFIMAGEDECKVTVCYDDGTSITRGRTRKDTGYYDVYYRDENGTLQRANYRGFTNAVPVEVANVHQMPKVNITKDIETHLNVLSQLDGPFLLTESPLVKASAIGRITGTHVIDAAVKESNKTIQGNRKLIKNYEEDLREKENELRTLPDTQLMHAFSTVYSALVLRMKRLHADIDEINDRVTHIQNLNNSIIQAEEQYNQCCIMKGLLPIVNSAINKQRLVNGLSVYLMNYQKAQSDISQQEQILLSTKILTAIKPLVDKAFNLKHFTVDQLSSRLTEYNRVVSDELVAKNTLDMYCNYRTELKKVITHCQLLYDYNMRIAPKVYQIKELEENQSNTVQNLATIKRTVKRFEKSIKDTQQEKNEFILSHGICPCCGQKVSESHVSAITTFMEGQ